MKKYLLSPFIGFTLLACGNAETGERLPLVSAQPHGPMTRPVGINYPWLKKQVPSQSALAIRFTPPSGCQRIRVATGSWGEWLRWLPLAPPGTPARVFDGSLKNRQDVVAAVVNIDVGTQDLQQCADAVIRLRAEYQFNADPNKVHFHLTTGYDFRFSDFVNGQTFKVVSNNVRPAARTPEAPTHAALGRYLIPAFGYAGTLSLSRELLPQPLSEVQPGDVLIHGGSPGHAVLVVDVAENSTSHQKYMLLAQSYMPAQSIHVLNNIWGEPTLGVWFPVNPNDNAVTTPEWGFKATELARFE